MKLALSMSLKKYIMSFLILILAFSTMNIQVSAKEMNNLISVPNGEFELIKKDDNEVIVQGTWSEGILIGTMNLKTDEVIIEEILNERPNKRDKFFASGKEEGIKNIYRAKITTLDPNEGIVDAVLINVDTNEEFALYADGDTEGGSVDALFAPAIPLVVWGGSALVSWLAIHAAAITIVGVTAYLASDVVTKYRENKTYNYWQAWVRNDKVYISSKALSDSDAFVWISTANDPEVNLFAKTEAKAQQAASRTKHANSNVYHEPHSQKDGYYRHYHPTFYNVQTREVSQFKNHVWF